MALACRVSTINRHKHPSCAFCVCMSKANTYNNQCNSTIVWPQTDSGAKPVAKTAGLDGRNATRPNKSSLRETQPPLPDSSVRQLATLLQCTYRLGGQPPFAPILFHGAEVWSITTLSCNILAVKRLARLSVALVSCCISCSHPRYTHT